MFEIIKAKLIKLTEKWHDYLKDKELILGTSIDGNWNLYAIDGDGDLNKFCEYIWSIEDEHDYETLEDLQEDVALGNYGFTLLQDEIEKIDTIASSDKL